MTVKSILCIFGGAPEESSMLDVAFALAELHQAHIRFLHISLDPQVYMQPADMQSYAEIIDRLKDRNETQLAEARRYVTQFASRYHVPLDDPDLPLHHASARFLHREGMVGDSVALEGRLSDLILVARGTPSAPMPYESAILPALFDTGRPVLLLPMPRDPQTAAWRDKVVALAWDGSLESARATRSALFFLARAERLYILHAHERAKSDGVTSSLALSDYLQTHGIQGANVVSLDAKPQAIGETLLNKAKELEADLLVMGAYGHNRYLEMFLGGVTADLLKKADIPLFLSH